MNTNVVQSQIAVSVAAKIGITGQQAGAIVGHITQFCHSNLTAATQTVPEIGRISLTRIAPTGARAVRMTEAEAKFKVGEMVKRIRLREPNWSRGGSIKYSLAGNSDSIQISYNTLEGDQDTSPPRDRKKKKS